MNDRKQEKKRGLFAALSGLLRGGGSPAAGGLASGMRAAGGLASGMRSAGGLGGLFATKGGILGMVLGAATIAAGVGVVYNFIGPSKPLYSSELFRNSYYDEESSRAGSERARARDASGAAYSTLDMFREQAKKDGLDGLASEAVEDGGATGSAETSASADSSAADSAAAASAMGVDGAAGAVGAGAPRLQAMAGFGGGGGTSMSGTQPGGGAQGQSVYKPSAQAGGKISAMNAAAALKAKNSAKFVPKISKKGAFGQAKFANKMGAKAAYSAGNGVGARTDATTAFSGETAGAGTVGSPVGGAGLRSAGVSDGSALKGSDPTFTNPSYTPPTPTVPETKAENPWKATEDRAMKFALIAGGLVLATLVLSKFKSPWTYYAAMITAMAAIAAAAVVIAAGIKMMLEYGQKMIGLMYIGLGVMLAIAAWNALVGAAQSQVPNAAGKLPFGANALKDAGLSLKGLFGGAAAAAGAK